ncbi:hypothetical protein KM043_007562 [Ampulex compressa]|nr:hypothetical protein KM043_007562 [Ampulex compressa]
MVLKCTVSSSHGSALSCRIRGSKARGGISEPAPPRRRSSASSLYTRVAHLLSFEPRPSSTPPERGHLLDHKNRPTRRPDYVISDNGLIAPVAPFTRRT